MQKVTLHAAFWQRCSVHIHNLPQQRWTGITLDTELKHSSGQGWFSTQKCHFKTFSFLVGPRVHVLRRSTLWMDHTHNQKNPCCRQMESNEKVNSKQRDKAGRRVSGPVCDLAFQDVSVSLPARSIPLPAPRSVMKDTGPIRAWRI